VSEASTAVNKHLSQILAQIQTGDYDSAIENIGFAIGDDLEELIEAGMVQDRQGTAPDAITVEHVVLARRFIPHLRANCSDAQAGRWRKAGHRGDGASHRRVESLGEQRM